MKDIVIIGAGGLGREILGLIQSINKKESRWRVKGFYDDGAECGKLIHGLPILGKVEALNAQQEALDVAIAIGDSSTRRKDVYKRQAQGYIQDWSCLIYISRCDEDC